MAIDEEFVRNALKNVKYPGYSRDIVSFGMVKDILLEGKSCTVTLGLIASNPRVSEGIQNMCEAVLRQLGEFNRVTVKVIAQAPATSPPQPARIPGIRHAIAVASGKGGVGKSTVAVNLALAFAHLGSRVGLLDGDVYGPSIPLMMNVKTSPPATNEKLDPVTNYGVKIMSMGFLVDASRPVIWRGPMVARVVQQFITEVNWGELDYLVVDLPPGTGDAQLTLCQTLSLDGAVIVTTPQEIALADVRKAVALFQQVGVPILGIIENMSYFVCPGDRKRYDIFGSGGGAREAQRLQVPLLAQIPMEAAIREGGDQGQPLLVASKGAASAKAFLQAAETLRKRLA